MKNILVKGIKDKKAITLIALVITIVILIILAAVSINLTIGENGIITRTKQAAFESKIAEYKEKLSLTIIDEKLDRAETEKEEPFIRSLADRIQDLDFVKENGITLLKDDTELQSGDNEALANKLEVETKEGYVFIIEVDNNTLEANILDEVIKEVANYTITYKANISGGSQADIVESVRAGRSAKTKSSTAFTRNGFSLIGWSTNSGATVGEYSVGEDIGQVANDITLYAVWNSNTANVTFDINGGNGGIMSVQPVPKGVATALTANNYSRTNYTFDSWNTESNGSGTRYVDNAEITTTENITLYAIWKDATAPNVTLSGTLGQITIAATDSESGVTGYVLKTSNTAPNTSEYTSWNGSSKAISISNNTMQYLWVKNEEGLITAKSFQIHEHQGNTTSGGACYQANTKYYKNHSFISQSDYPRGTTSTKTLKCVNCGQDWYGTWYQYNSEASRKKFLGTRGKLL